LRGPGETLKRRVAEIDERFIYEFLGGWAAGLLAFCVIALAALKMGGLTDRHSFYAGTIGWWRAWRSAGGESSGY